MQLNLLINHLLQKPHDTEQIKQTEAYQRMCQFVLKISTSLKLNINLNDIDTKPFDSFISEPILNVLDNLTAFRNDQQKIFDRYMTENNNLTKEIEQLNAKLLPSQTNLDIINRQNDTPKSSTENSENVDNLKDNERIRSELNELKMRYSNLLIEYRNLLPLNSQKNNIFPSIEDMVFDYTDIVTTRKRTLVKAMPNLDVQFISGLLIKCYSFTNNIVQKFKLGFYNSLTISPDNNQTSVNNFIFSYLQANYNKKEIFRLEENVQEFMNIYFTDTIHRHTNALFEFTKDSLNLTWKFNLLNPPITLDTSSVYYSDKLHEEVNSNTLTKISYYIYPSLIQGTYVHKKGKVKIE